MPRYKGTITDLKDPRFGFIGLSTVTRADGRPAELATKKDIFIHQGNFREAEALSVGLEVVFDITNDSTRPKSFRASRIVPVTHSPVEGGVEIHFDELGVEHPTVPVHWCIKPEGFERMKQQPHSEWILVLVGQNEDESRKGRVIKSVVGTREIGLGRGYFTFPTPGDYHFVGYLIRTDNNSDYVKKVTGAIDRYFKNHNLWNKYDNELSFDFPDYIDAWCEITATTQRRDVSVPDGIFAKPLPNWLKTWLGYFGAERPDDECATRFRVPLACTLGLIWYVFWETLKRVSQIVVGLLHLAVGGNPLAAWSEATTRRLSAFLPSGFLGKRDFTPLTSYAGLRNLYRPLPWLLIGAIVTVYATMPISRNFIGTAVIVSSVVATVVITVLVMVYWKMKQLENSEEERQQVARDKVAELASQRLEHISTYAVCGVTPVDKPTSVALYFTGIKRKVCRPYV